MINAMAERPAYTVTIPMDAVRRRRALTIAGCATYVIHEFYGVDAILCLCCGRISTHRMDIAERFCGCCKAWHSEWQEA